MVESCRNLVVLKSMSKVFGVAGIRLGYLLSGDRSLIDAVRSFLPIWNINGLAEDFLRTVGRYRSEFDESCELTRLACREFYEDLQRPGGYRADRTGREFHLVQAGGSQPDGA